MRPLSEHKNVDKTFLHGVEAVKSKEWWVSAGTALGLYRDGDFIPSDTDLDVEVLADWDNPDPIDEIEGFKSFRFINAEGKPMQRAFQDKNGVIFDIYYFYPDGEYAFNYNDHGEMRLPIRFFKDRKELDTKYGKLYFPHPIEEYLEYRYGKDWRKPSNSKGLYDKSI